MKQALIAVMTVLMAAALVVAQTQSSGAKPAAPQPQQPGAPPQQPGAQPGQLPAGQAQPAQPPLGGKPQPQAKTQEEFKAFQEANAKVIPTAANPSINPAEVEAAANDFATKFPPSELIPLLYLQAMRAYQQTDNAEKTVEMGRKVLQFDATSPEALVTVATVLSERTRETDLDRDERLNEATKDANLAMQSVDTGLTIPPGTPPERVDAVKKVLVSMAYAALGTVDMTRKNYPSAEQNLKKAVELNTLSPDPVTYLRLAVVLDQQKKYPEALATANKAVEYSPADSQVSNLSKQERDRLVKLTGGTPGTPGTTPPPGATPPKPPTPPPAQQTPPPAE